MDHPSLFFDEMTDYDILSRAEIEPNAERVRVLLYNLALQLSILVGKIVVLLYALDNFCSSLDGCRIALLLLQLPESRITV